MKDASRRGDAEAESRARLATPPLNKSRTKSHGIKPKSQSLPVRRLIPRFENEPRASVREPPIRSEGHRSQVVDRGSARGRGIITIRDFGLINRLGRPSLALSRTLFIIRRPKASRIFKLALPRGEETRRELERSSRVAPSCFLLAVCSRECLVHSEYAV